MVMMAGERKKEIVKEEDVEPPREERSGDRRLVSKAYSTLFYNHYLLQQKARELSLECAAEVKKACLLKVKP